MFSFSRDDSGFTTRCGRIKMQSQRHNPYIGLFSHANLRNNIVQNHTGIERNMLLGHRNPLIGTFRHSPAAALMMTKGLKGILWDDPKAPYLSQLNISREINNQKQINRAKLQMLPYSRFSKNSMDETIDVDDGPQCSICLEYFQDGDEFRSLSCSHCFHRCCIDAWLECKSRCPLCSREPIFDHHPTDPCIDLSPDESSNEESSQSQSQSQSQSRSQSQSQSQSQSHISEHGSHTVVLQDIEIRSQSTCGLDIEYMDILSDMSGEQQHVPHEPHTTIQPSLEVLPPHGSITHFSIRSFDSSSTLASYNTESSTKSSEDYTNESLNMDNLIQSILHSQYSPPAMISMGHFDPSSSSSLSIASPDLLDTDTVTEMGTNIHIDRNPTTATTATNATTYIKSQQDKFITSTRIHKNHITHSLHTATTTTQVQEITCINDILNVQSRDIMISTNQKSENNTTFEVQIYPNYLNNTRSSRRPFMSHNQDQDQEDDSDVHSIHSENSWIVLLDDEYYPSYPVGLGGRKKETSSSAAATVPQIVSNDLPMIPSTTTTTTAINASATNTGISSATTSTPTDAATTAATTDADTILPIDTSLISIPIPILSDATIIDATTNVTDKDTLINVTDVITLPTSIITVRDVHTTTTNTTNTTTNTTNTTNMNLNKSMISTSPLLKMLPPTLQLTLSTHMTMLSEAEGTHNTQLPVSSELQNTSLSPRYQFPNGIQITDNYFSIAE